MTHDDDPTTDLRALLPRGAQVYTILRHVNRERTRREVSFLTIHPNTRAIRNLDLLVAHVMGLELGWHDGLKVSGSGFDIGFALVDQLARKLYADARALSHAWL